MTGYDDPQLVFKQYCCSFDQLIPVLLTNIGNRTSDVSIRAVFGHLMANGELLGDSTNRNNLNEDSITLCLKYEQVYDQLVEHKYDINELLTSDHILLRTLGKQLYQDSGLKYH